MIVHGDTSRVSEIGALFPGSPQRRNADAAVRWPGDMSAYDNQAYYQFTFPESSWTAAGDPGWPVIIRLQDGGLEWMDPVMTDNGSVLPWAAGQVAISSDRRTISFPKPGPGQSVYLNTAEAGTVVSGGATTWPANANWPTLTINSRISEDPWYFEVSGSNVPLNEAYRAGGILGIASADSPIVLRQPPQWLVDAAMSGAQVSDGGLRHFTYEGGMGGISGGVPSFSVELSVTRGYPGVVFQESGSDTYGFTWSTLSTVGTTVNLVKDSPSPSPSPVPGNPSSNPVILAALASYPNICVSGGGGSYVDGTYIAVTDQAQGGPAWKMVNPNGVYSAYIYYDEAAGRYRMFRTTIRTPVEVAWATGQFGPWTVIDGSGSNISVSEGACGSGLPVLDPVVEPLTGTIQDLSSTGMNFSANGSLFRSVGGGPFGDNSVLFGGDGAVLTAPSGSTSLVGNGDFTIEFWYKKAGNPDAYGRIFQTRDGDLHSGIGVFFDNASDRIVLFCSGYGNNWDTSNVTVGTATADQWRHFAIVRSGDTLKTYQDGVLQETRGISHPIYHDSGDSVVVGGQTGGRKANGYMADLRITKGVARYAGDFSPPAGSPDINGDPYGSSVSLLLGLD